MKRRIAIVLMSAAMWSAGCGYHVAGRSDALFGERTCVKDSHDRYANIEINYLLEQIERFHGIAILAMNLKHNIDPTILCRFQFVVNFQQ